MNKIEKGSIIFVSGIWYVVLDNTEKYISCICDHANNIHGWEIDHVTYIATPYEAMRAKNWDQGEEELLELNCEREIPSDVIAEVLSGCHDDRMRK